MSRIGFVWYWEQASAIKPKWRDGLRAAIEIISQKHEVRWFLDKEVPSPDEPWDFLLFWSDAYGGFFNELNLYTARKGICLTTEPKSPLEFDNLRKLDVVYCESRPVYETVRREGIHAVKAFGTDTLFFSPGVRVTKSIEYFYPATFSPWKRQSEIAYLGDKLTCLGTVQPDGLAELEACKKNGVNIIEGYFNAKKIRNMYRQSERVIIPAVHGSERTVLEAMSMDILPMITNPLLNVKANSYIEEYREMGYDSPREFVIDNYSHFIYADNLLKGIENG
jgi:hypothetical protein